MWTRWATSEAFSVAVNPWRRQNHNLLRASSAFASTPEPSSTLKLLYFISQVSADRTCEFKDGERWAGGIEVRKAIAGQRRSPHKLRYCRRLPPYSHSVVSQQIKSLNTLYKEFFVAPHTDELYDKKIC
jgi:hypothetical protein